MPSNSIYDPSQLTEKQLRWFKPTRLYVKELAGVKYFGKTCQTDAIKYRGSGTIWKCRIKKYGADKIKTTWVSNWFYDPWHIQQFALMFSELNDIVESKEWANYKPENGLDGGGNGGANKGKSTKLKGHKFPQQSESHRKKNSEANKGRIRGPQSAEHKAKKAWPKGKKQTPETCLKKSLSHIGIKRGPYKKRQSIPI